MPALACPNVFIPEPQPVRKNGREPIYPESDGKPMGESDLHRDVNNYIVESLKLHFSDRTDDAYVSGDNFLYFVQNNPRRFVSPDVYVVFGVPMRPRKTYRSWDEGHHLPSVVIEVTSATTHERDLESKFILYQDVLLVPEYFLFDPTGEFISPPLAGFRLNSDGDYVAIPLINNALHSEQLGLDFVLTPNGVRIFDPTAGTFYPTFAEQREAAYRDRLRADEETKRAEDEAKRAEDEAKKSAETEAENVRLRAIIAQLEAQNAGGANGSGGKSG